MDRIPFENVAENNTDLAWVADPRKAVLLTLEAESGTILLQILQVKYQVKCRSSLPPITINAGLFVD